MRTRKWTGQCQRCGKNTSSYIMSWYSECLICLECSDKEQQKADIQDVKDADALDYLRRHGYSTKDLEQQIQSRKQGRLNE